MGASRESPEYDSHESHSSSNTWRTTEETPLPPKKRRCFKCFYARSRYKCLHPSLWTLHLFRFFEIPIQIAFFICLIVVQRELPEGPPYFNLLTETVRTFRNVSVPQSNETYYYWKGNVLAKNRKEIRVEILKVPVGVWFQLTAMVRLLFSCFVGYHSNGEVVTAMPRVFKNVAKDMWKIALMGFPYQVLVYTLRAFINPWLAREICFYFCYIGLARVIFILSDTRGLKVMLEPFYTISFILVWGFFIEQMFSHIWTTIPYLKCGHEYYRGREEKWRYLDCYDEDCKLMRMKLDKCLKKTWLYQIE